MTARTIRTGAIALALGMGALSVAQLRVLQWNVTNYSNNLPDWRVPHFQTALFGTFSGRSARPDVIVGQEFISDASCTEFLNMLNTAPGSPGDYARAPFDNGNDTDNMLFYRTSKVDYVGRTIISVGGGNPAPPRNTLRYDIRPKGYGVASATLAIYCTHMKSGQASTDYSRRLLEAERIRLNHATTVGTNPTSNFMVCGDFNIQSSSWDEYQAMVDPISPAGTAGGRFFDPINSPGSWYQNTSFKMIHTQEPGTQMDDRHDQILISSNLFDGSGLDYIGDITKKFSTTTWNDLNHSYRCWGNDGNSYLNPINTATNSQVGGTIAQALINTMKATPASVANGHLPVYLDLRVPPDCNTTTTLVDLGYVNYGQVVNFNFGVTNSANTALWTAAGIQPLSYTLSSDKSSVVVPAGNQTAAAGTTTNHTATLTAKGFHGISGTISVNSNSPLNPSRTIQWTAYVRPIVPVPLPFRGARFDAPADK